MQEYKQHLIALGVKPGSQKDCFHPYNIQKKGRGGHHHQPPQGVNYQPMPAPSTWSTALLSPPPPGWLQEVETLAEDMAVGVTLAVASSNSLLNDTYQMVLPLRNPGQRPTS